jgi:hypothetical protein
MRRRLCLRWIEPWGRTGTTATCSGFGFPRGPGELGWRDGLRLERQRQAVRPTAGGLPRDESGSGISGPVQAPGVPDTAVRLRDGVLRQRHGAQAALRCRRKRQGVRARTARLHATRHFCRVPGCVHCRPTPFGGLRVRMALRWAAEAVARGSARRRPVPKRDRSRITLPPGTTWRAEALGQAATPDQCRSWTAGSEVSVGDRATLRAKGPGWHLQQLVPAPCARSGHRGSGHRSTLTLAIAVRRARDRDIARRCWIQFQVWVRIWIRQPFTERRAAQVQAEPSRRGARNARECYKKRCRSHGRIERGNSQCAQSYSRRTRSRCLP